jgi:hypothetical protein
MSVMGDVTAWSRGSEGSTTSPSPSAPTISPNRRRLDRVAPSLAFTVRSIKPFVEVVLTTDRALFDPSRAPLRTPHNFFASRTFGLTQLGGLDTTYIVPAAVLRAFLESHPRPREIFYTAIGYDDDAARSPALAQPTKDLVERAPSIGVAPDFTVHGLSRAFGTALGKLVRHGGEGLDAGFAATGPAPGVASPAPRTWSGTGEIRLPVAASLDETPERLDARDAGLQYADDDHESRGAAASYGAADEDDDRSRLSLQSGAPPRLDCAGRPPAAAGAGEALAYDDGFGAFDGSAEAGDDRPAGAEPAELDEDVASAYGDEGDDDRDGRTARSADTNGAAPRASAPSATPAPVDSGAAPALPSPAELRPVLDRVARTHDGSSLYRIARKTAHGVRFGIGSFDQRSGALGRVLARMNQTDAATFRRIFGEDADQLLSVTTAANADARMAPVSGRALGDPAWIERFAQAGAHRPFVEAQNEVLVATVLAPMWPVLSGFGLTSPRAVAVALVLGIQMGPGEASTWIAARLAPVQTPAQTQQVLAAIGAPDLAAFQRRERLEPTGRLDAVTQAALARALRRLGTEAPVPVPTPAQMLEGIARHLGHEGAGRKVAALLADAEFADRPR